MPRLFNLSLLTVSSAASSASAIFMFNQQPLGSGPVVAGSVGSGGFPVATKPPTPIGVADDPADPTDSSLLVECDDADVPVSTKQIFSTMMGCNREKGGEQYALCAPYMKGGCDNELCHDFCVKMYHSSNAYEGCRCKSTWGTAKLYREFSPGAPCPLKIQPRCYMGDMYRSECEALAAVQGISAADLAVVPQSSWDKEDMSSVKEKSPKCKSV